MRNNHFARVVSHWGNNAYKVFAFASFRGKYLFCTPLVLIGTLILLLIFKMCLVVNLHALPLLASTIKYQYDKKSDWIVSLQSKFGLIKLTRF